MDTFARRLIGGLVACALFACGRDRAAERSDVEILWDRWGVPHIHAVDEPALFRGFGWAQMRAHGDLLLRLYGTARGRAAEYWGETFVDSDRWIHTVGVPARAAEWYAEQSPEFRACLDAFAAGINAFGREHTDELAPDVRVVLPVDGVDVLAHAQRVLQFLFLAHPSQLGGGRAPSGGSNAWAIAPSRSANGRALLLANPHLPWGDAYTFFEAELACGELDVSGAALVGFPTLGIAFNTRLGWTHTVNPQDGVDLFELVPDADGYRWNGERRAFDVERVELRVRGDDGELSTREFDVRRSACGPLVDVAPGKLVALRVVGLDRPRALQQWWDMARAQDLAAFERALSAQQLPLFSVVYADGVGHVLYDFGGLTPRRSDQTTDWTRPVRADSDAVVWHEYLTSAELPRVVDPPSGWLQNANDPPWSATEPPTLFADDFPSGLAPRSISLRAQRSIELLRADESIALDELVAYKHSSRMGLADRVLDELLPLASASATERVRRAASVLERWDREARAESRGAVLFATWVSRLGASGQLFANPWDPQKPLETPDGLADPIAACAALDAAAATLEKQGLALDVAWGDVYRLRGGGHDLPCNGAMESLGVFRAFEFASERDGKKRVVGGDSFVAAIEFADEPRAFAVMAYGNASQSGSPHRFDQLPLVASGQLRPVLRGRAAGEAECVEREFVPPR
ncbi:MAG: acylase [Planctomycetes bacterium]|nr:acylase [Planctomycetota bacterium]